MQEGPATSKQNYWQRQKYFYATGSKFAKTSCSKQNSSQKPQINNEGSVPVKRYGNYKNYPKTVTGGSVTGAAEAMSPVQLTNRFQPLLLMNSADDVCSSQSRLTDQTKNIFMEKKNKLGNCKGILKMSAYHHHTKAIY